jgi:hypothetical protein
VTKHLCMNVISLLTMIVRMSVTKMLRGGSIKTDYFSLDISSCKSLEELEIYQSTINIGTTGIHFPKSLRLLIIRDANILPKDTWPFISAPGLVTLELVNCMKWTPFLGSMPSLVRALIRIGEHCVDSSHKHNFCGVCAGREDVHCYGIDDRVLFRGLSSATNLELLSPSSMVCFFFSWYACCFADSLLLFAAIYICTIVSVKYDTSHVNLCNTQIVWLNAICFSINRTM